MDNSESYGGVIRLFMSVSISRINFMKILTFLNQRSPKEKFNSTEFYKKTNRRVWNLNL